MRLSEATANDSEVNALLEDYIGLYTRDTLERWRDLFLPDFIATSTNDDGSTTTRGLDAFYERQRALFATGKPVSEVFRNTEIRRANPLAFVYSDFVWTDTEITRHGRLMMLLIVERGALRIQALTFSYQDHGADRPR
jgi:hypothetical protein